MSLCYEQNIFKDDADPVSRHVQVFRICLFRNDKYEIRHVHNFNISLKRQIGKSHNMGSHLYLKMKRQWQHYYWLVFFWRKEILVSHNSFDVDSHHNIFKYLLYVVS